MKFSIMYVKRAVELVLKNDLRARDDDKWLIVEVLKKLGFNVMVEKNNVNINIPYYKFCSLPAFESITRCRRQFQENGLYPSTKRIRFIRRLEENSMRKIKQWF